MEFMQQYGLILIISAVLSVFVNYWIIRTAVFHGMRRHTEWMQGKRK